MIPMKNLATQASEKLKEGQKAVTGQKEKVMAPAVYSQLITFCWQNEEFAGAVIKGGSFADCMKKVAAGVGNSISDLDAYKKAVQFYFPGAEVKMSLTINLGGKTAETEKANTRPESAPREEKTSKIISLDFDGFFD